MNTPKLDNLPSVALLREYFSYCPRSGEIRVIKHRRCGPPVGDLATCADGKGYLLCCCFGKRILAHRAAWALHHGEWPQWQVDHLDGVCDNNRIANLREATHTENMRNRSKHKNNSSGFKGVSMDKRSGRWRAQIWTGGQHGTNKRLGWFDTPDEAHKAYLDASSRIHGDFANSGI